MLCNTISLAARLKNNIELVSGLSKETVIEIPCYEHSKLYNCVDRCVKEGRLYSLHYPSYYSCSKVGFSSEADIDDILDNAEEYYNRYGEAEYFVCHFPIHSYTVKNIDSAVLKYTVERLNDMSRKVPVLVENISIVSNCCRAAEYAEYLKTADNLKLCLDLGHAFLVDRDEPVNFINNLKEKIRAVHYYNTCYDGMNRGKHLEVNSSKLTGENSMDMKKINTMLFGLPYLKWIVDESEDN